MYLVRSQKGARVLLVRMCLRGKRSPYISVDPPFLPWQWQVYDSNVGRQLNADGWASSARAILPRLQTVPK